MNQFQVLDITVQFKEKWSSLVNPKLTILQIYQTDEDVCLKYVLGQRDDENIIIEEKLNFITGANNFNFIPQHTLQTNAEEFLKLSSLTIIHCFDHLFDENMVDFIIDYNSEGISDDQIFFNDDLEELK